MIWRPWFGRLMPLLIMAFAAMTAGCGQTEHKKEQDSQGTKADKDLKKTDDDSWWCAEHGVPEEICGQCNAKAAAEFKKKGDWCNEHDRPKSQCFLCDPKVKDKFAAQYRAKYGKEPPPAENEPKKKRDSDPGSNP